MKKNKSLIALLIALLLCIGLYSISLNLAKRESEGDGDEGESEKITILSKNAEDVLVLSHTTSSSSLEIKYSGEAYLLSSDPSFPLDQYIASGMAEAVSHIECDRLVTEDAAKFAEYGLDEPKQKIAVTFDGGAKLNINIGNYNEYTDSYYLNIAGESSVYLISTDMVDAFDYSLNELLVDEELEEPIEAFDSIHKITVDVKNGEDCTYTFIKGQEAETDESGKEISAKVEDRWEKRLGSSLLDGDFSEEAEELYDEIFDLSLVEWADYNVTESEELAAFGLSEPYIKISFHYIETVAVSDGETSTSVSKDVEKTASVLIGNTVETGDEDADGEEDADGRYLLIEGGKVVYIISEEMLESTLSCFTADK